MKKKLKNKNISRKKFLLSLGGLPILTLVSTPKVREKAESDLDEFDILLKSDGNTVKVKKSILDKSIIVKNRIDNQTMKSWLKK